MSWTIALRVVLSGLARNGPVRLFLPIVLTRSLVRRRRKGVVDVPGVVGISLWDLPRVGVRGGSGSERLEVGGGAASDGRTGVEVWR